MAILAKEKILTLDYWKPASQLEVGDYIFDRNGNVVKITSLQTYMANRCYTVHLDDYFKISGDHHMKLMVETPKYRKRLCEYKGRFKFRRPLVVSPIEEILNKPLRTKRNRKTFSIPTCQPLQFPHQDLAIPPFVMGFWHRYGQTNNYYTIKGKYYKYFKEKMQDYGYELKRHNMQQETSIGFRIYPDIKKQLTPNIPNQLPHNYLLASEEQRLELLSGLVISKSKQYIPSKNMFRISTPSWPNAHRIQGLIESLGCKTTVHFDPFTKYYKIYFRTWHIIHPDQEPSTRKIHQDRRYIDKIEEIQPQLCVHIETDGEDGSFLAGEGFITCR